jgi:hypothetical protein
MWEQNVKSYRAFPSSASTAAAKADTAASSSSLGGLDNYME